MGKKMQRGKQQVLFNYLPGMTFDYSGESITAKVISIRGDPETSISLGLVLGSIRNYVRSWRPEFRPTLSDNCIEGNQEKFVLINPRRVESTIFPRIFYCSNPECGRIYKWTESSHIPTSSRCKWCNHGTLKQIRWIKVHRCGAMNPLEPPYRCNNCGSSAHWALDTKGSEKFRDFVWVCRNCGNSMHIFPNNCRECDWREDIQGVANPKKMSIDLFSAHSTYYPHYVVLLNMPTKDFDRILTKPEWPELIAAAYLDLPELNGKKLKDIDNATEGILSKEKIAELRKIGIPVTEEQERKLSTQNMDIENILSAVCLRTGVPHPIWERNGREILESIIPVQSNSPIECKNSTLMDKYGFSSIILNPEFPIITATFGYSRVDYRPNYCRINAFPNDPEIGGKNPIYIDKVTADAILVRLNPFKIIQWLKDNGLTPEVPNGTDSTLSEIAYFVQLFSELSCRSTIDQNPEARMVFGLLHTYSHLCIRQAALLAGLDSTSLSEYILPHTLTIAIYSNHRFGASIGALSTLFEDDLQSWFDNISEASRCIYDPVCSDQGGSCHACTHLAETSCRYFNLNLSRAFLFGGYDEIQKKNIRGYL